MRQTETTIHVFEIFKRSGKPACHFVDVVEEVGGRVLFRTRSIGR